MKRMHLHVSVPDLAGSIDFYRPCSATAPAVRHDDYAKWMLDDPHVNFAISHRSRATGIDHLGIQVEARHELTELAGRLNAAGAVTVDQENASCCYAQSDKSWVKDPSGISWETFFTFGGAAVYGEDVAPAAIPAVSCCGVAPKQTSAACC